jgi:hypothetical protein
MMVRIDKCILGFVGSRWSYQASSLSRRPRMQLKTILNRVAPHKSFVYGKVRWLEDAAQLTLQVEIEPRANGRPICSGCGQQRPGYDRLPARRFEFVPLRGLRVWLLYHMRRVSCPTCGVKVEQVPWAEGKSTLTAQYRWFLARWARRMSWKEVAAAFHVSWDRVYEAVKSAVSWGLERHRGHRTARPRRCCGSSGSWGASVRPPWSSCAATCGGPI